MEKLKPNQQEILNAEVLSKTQSNTALESLLVILGSVGESAAKIIFKK